MLSLVKVIEFGGFSPLSRNPAEAICCTIRIGRACLSSLQSIRSERIRDSVENSSKCSYKEGNMQNQMTESSPLSDLMFDWIAILHSKAEGLQAYEKYMKDAKDEDSQECIDLLQRLQKQDQQMVAEIRDHLAMMLAKDESSQLTGSRNMGKTGQTKPNLENPNMMV